MSNPPPGLGGSGGGTSGAIRGPPPGFGSPSSMSPGNRSGGTSATDGSAGTTSIIKAQISFLVSSLVDDTYEKAANEVRSLASSIMPDMYHHFLRRSSHIASPVLQTLYQHYGRYQDDPAAPPPSIPSSGHPSLNWRLLCEEAARASRDINLAAHFTMIMLSPSAGTPLPIPSLRIFNLSPSQLFSLSAYTLASPSVFPPTHPAFDAIHTLLRQTYVPTMDLLRSPNIPFWSQNPESSDDLTLQEARTLILALYPRSESSGDSSSRPATPTNPTSPHPSPLVSEQRTGLLSSLSIKFSSPAIVLQTLSALSPGGAPRSPGSIPLEDVLFELGETLTQDEGTVEAVIYRWWGPYLLDGGSVDKEAVTEEAGKTIIGLFEGLHEGRSIDLHGVVKGMTAIESIDFPALVRTLDVPHTPAAYPSSIGFLLALLMIPPQQPLPPIAGLLPADLESPSWTHTESLLAILSRLSVMAPDRLPIFLIPNAASPTSYARIIDPPSNDQAMSTKLKQAAVDLQSAGMWNILGLFRVLVEACSKAESDQGNEQSVEIGRMAMGLLDRAAEVVPEMTLVAFEKLPAPLPSVLHDMHRRLLGMYLSNPFAQIQSSQLVFHTLKRVNLPALLDVLLEFYQENETNLPRVLEIAQEVKILDKLLGADNIFYALDVACLAATEKYINLEKWLSDGIEVKDHGFLEGIFDFVENKVRAEIDAKHQPDSAPKPPNRLDIEVYSIFIRVIRRAPDLSREDISRFKHLRTDILIVNPKLLNLRPGSTEEQGFTVAKFDKAMTEQADKMFQRMYGGHIQLDDVISELKRLLKSDDPNDNETFACAMHALFDEHAFVKNYPPNELTMTGILFGAIIDYRLVKDIPAFVATRYVLDACKTPPHEPVYQFGINALSILRASLVDFPGLCRSLLEIPALHESHPVLINDIMSALAEREDLDQQGGVKLAFPALKLPVMVEEGVDEFVEPEPAKKDRIMFIINQIDPSNYDARSKDLVGLFEDQYSRWFAHYFIDVRVSLEQNRHEIYMQLLEAIKSPVLERHVLWETYRKARDLLNSEATINSAAERATLKTVALWLGRITLARNIPLRLRDLSLKDLLIQGFDNQRLIVAIPFVCNLLSQCEHSTVFHLPNPWLASILKLLIEFYHFATLKLNLKFEIEVLFKNKLYVDKDKIEPSDVLRTHIPPPPPQEDTPDRLQQEYQRATAELENESQRFEQPPLDPAFARMQAFQNEQAAQAAQDAFMRRVDELVATLPEYLTFSPEYPIFTAPTLQRVVHHSINRAIRDIVQPVVERSVTIAGISSRDLVQKDFGMEGDASKMRHSAHLMVQNLAGNLAIVTCKEPLRSSMMNNIRTMLAQNGFTEENMPDAMIAGVVNDNLDAGCGVIRKAAMEKAVKDIDVNLSPQYAARRAHREAGSRQPFWDGASFGVALSHAALPDALRLHSGGLGPAQLRVYEDFGEPSRILQQSGTNGDYAYQERQERLLAEQGRRGLSPYPEAEREPRDRAPSPRVLSAQAALEKFQELVSDMDKHLSRAEVQTLINVAPDSELRALMRGVIYVANNSSNREGTTLVIAQKVVQLLYKTATGLGREVYVFLLQQLCELSKKVEKEVKHWLIYAEDNRKLNVPVIVTLVRTAFINIQELDAQLASVIRRSYAPEMMDFVSDLIRACSLAEDAVISRTGFAACLAALLDAHDKSRSTQTVDALLADMRGPRQSSDQLSLEPINDATKSPDIEPELKERLAQFFLEWVRMYSKTKPETAFVPYVTFLQKEEILRGDDVSSAFYRTAIDTAVDLDTAKLDVDPSFYGTDALANLIVLIIKHCGDKNTAVGIEKQVYYFNKILTIASYTLIQRHAEENFSQRPWTRFFSSILSELNKFKAVLPETHTGCLKSFANVLGFIQPSYAPKFAFGWLSILSHRLFMPALLGMPREDGWADYNRALMWLLRFLEHFFQGEMTHPSRGIYQATIRLLLVILHDFPEFLDEFYHPLTTAIPHNCLQLRNIVLSAFPDSIKPLPDVYTRLDALVPEMQHFPTVRADYVEALSSGGVRAAIDQHVRTGVPALNAIVVELKNRIAVKTMVNGEPRVNWNRTLLHAAVFYLGTTCVARVARQRGVAEFDAKAPEVAILTELMRALDSDGQHYMLSVIADQLRYPSAHTLFFIHLILFMFHHFVRQDPVIAEYISRVVLERIIVHRPHPWGLVVTFVELMDNEVYNFWGQGFVRSEEEIFMLFATAQKSIASQAGHAPGVQSAPGSILPPGNSQGYAGQEMSGRGASVGTM